MNATQNASVGSAVSGINYHSLIATGSINPMGLALCAGKLEECLTVMRMMGITCEGNAQNFGGMIMRHLENWAADMRERSIALSGEALFNEMAKSVESVAKAAEKAAEAAQAAAKAEATSKPSSNVAKAAAAMANVLASHEAAVQQTFGKAAPKAPEKAAKTVSGTQAAKSIISIVKGGQAVALPAKKADPAPEPAKDDEPAVPSVVAQKATATIPQDTLRDIVTTRTWGDKAADEKALKSWISWGYLPVGIALLDAYDALVYEWNTDRRQAEEVRLAKEKKGGKKAAKAPAPKAKAAPTVSLPAPLDAIVKMPASEQWQAIVKMTADEVAAAAKALKIELVKNSMKNKSFILKAIQGK